MIYYMVKPEYEGTEIVVNSVRQGYVLYAGSLHTHHEYLLYAVYAGTQLLHSGKEIAERDDVFTQVEVLPDDTYFRRDKFSFLTTDRNIFVL
jgi:hypothetical protein